MDVENEKKAYLFFDDECPLCLRFKQSLERLPGTEHIEYISINEVRIEKFHNQISPENYKRDIHLINEENQVLIGAEAIEYIVEQFPLASKFTWLLEKEVTKKGMQRMYALGKGIRKRLNHSCPNC